MAVQDGQPVNASITNAAFISRTQDSDTTGKVGLKNTDLESGNIIQNTQKLLNQILDAQGNTGEDDATSKDYSSNNVVANGDDRKVAIGKLDAEFDSTTGHSHDGVDSAPINAENLAGHNPYSAEYQAKDITSVSGLTFDVSTDFSGDTAGGNDTTEGVITTSPNNKVAIIETANGQEIEDATGKRVFGRLTEAAGVWTLSFFVNDGGVETAHDLQPATDISIFYREVFGPANPRPTVPADIGSFDSLNVTADIVDASATQAGKVNTTTQSFAGQKTFTTGADINGDPVVSEAATQTLTNKTIQGASIETPSRLDVKQDTRANLETYALTATNGQFVFATDTKEMLQIVDNALVPVGGGAGGSLDFFYNEDFNAIDLADILVTGTWTKALETVTPISGDQSIKLTQASGSLGAYATVASIDLEENTKDNTIAFQTRYKYDGSDVDLEFRVYDVTNAQYIGSAPLKSTSSVKTAQIICNTRATTNQLEWRFVVVNENIGAVLDFDNVEGRLNPLTTQQNTQSESCEFQNLQGFGSTNTAIPYFTNERNNSFSELATISNDPVNGFSITFLKKCNVVMSFNSSGASTTYGGITRNSTDLSGSVATGANDAFRVAMGSCQNFADGVTFSGTAEAGDVLRPHAEGAANANRNDDWNLSIIASVTSDNVIFEQSLDTSNTNSFPIVIDHTTSTPTIVSDPYGIINNVVQVSALGYGRITFNSNIFTTTPNIVSGHDMGTATAEYIGIANTSATDFEYVAANSAGLSVPTVASFIVTKSSSDFKAKELVSVPVTNLVENVYSLKVDQSSGTPVILSQSSNFVESVSLIATGQYRVNFVSGFFSEIPSVTVGAGRSTGGDHIANYDNLSLTGFDVITFNSAGAVVNILSDTTVVRQGADYREPKGYFLGNLSQPVATLSHTESTGVSSGTLTGGTYTTRTLNTISDPRGIVTNLGSNQFTLSAGTYYIEGYASVHRVNRAKNRIRNITDSTTAILGASGFGPGIDYTSHLPINGEITITGSKTFELQTYAQSTRAADGGGIAVNNATDNETYAVIKITKLR